MTERPPEPERLSFRFPTVTPEIVAFQAQLPPFPGAPEGYAGSLDGLLEQVRSGAIDLRVLPLALLIDQYLTFLSTLPHPSIDTISEFVPMAATLIDLKSQLLAPSWRESVPDTASQEELVRQITCYEQNRGAAEAISTRTEIEEIGELPRLSLLDLMVLLRDVQSREDTSLLVGGTGLSVGRALVWIQSSLPPDQAVSADIYLEQCATVHDQAAVFLAMLELGKSRVLVCHQTEAFTPLWLGLGPNRYGSS